MLDENVNLHADRFLPPRKPSITRRPAMKSAFGPQISRVHCFVWSREDLTHRYTQHSDVLLRAQDMILCKAVAIRKQKWASSACLEFMAWLRESDVVRLRKIPRHISSYSIINLFAMLWLWCLWFLNWNPGLISSRIPAYPDPVCAFVLVWFKPAAGRYKNLHVEFNFSARMSNPASWWNTLGVFSQSSSSVAQLREFPDVIQYWPEREHVPTWKMRSLEETAEL